MSHFAAHPRNATTLNFVNFQKLLECPVPVCGIQPCIDPSPTYQPEIQMGLFNSIKAAQEIDSNPTASNFELILIEL